MGGNQPTTKQAIDPASLGARPRRTLKLGQRVAQAVLVLLLATGAFLSLFPWGRAFTRTALLLPALLSASEPAPLVLAGDPVSFKRMTISSSNGPVFLDIYQPTTPPPPIPGGREAIINIAGAGDQRAVPQLINLERSLAREGIVTVNVGTPSLFNYQVSARDGEAVVLAFQLLEHWPGVNPQDIGIIAFSVGDLLACAGAANPLIRDRVAFLGFLGGFFDATTLLATVGKRSQDVEGQIQSWQPMPSTFYTLSNTVNSLFSPTEKKLMLQAFPFNKIAPPLTARQQAQLSPTVDAFYHLLEGDEPGSVDRNLAALSPQMKALLTQLSPMSYINGIHAPIHLLHDRNDLSIPFSQAEEFAAALARLHHPYDFAGYSIFSHVQIRLDLALGQVLSDGTKLFGVLDNILLPGS